MGEIAWQLAAMALALGVVAALFACVALPMRRGVVAAVVVALAGLVLTSVAAAGVASRTDSCAAFHFSPERWQAALRADTRASDDAELIAAALIRCRTLEGGTGDEVRALLGPPHHRTRGGWVWIVGWTDDFLAPGDEVPFTVDFGHEGRAGPGALSSPDWS